ncbi:MAG: aldehyde dehydrogenase family protein [Pseudomonadota bacterium]|nr:aldehyde dehydrogenase family protein [Pseudomonadota bacterium]
MENSRKFYIDGQWVNPVNANDFDVIDPSTEEAIAVISLGGQADTDAAVAAASRAYDSWSQTSKAERLELMEAIAAEYERRSADIAQAMSDEMGAPIDFSNAVQVAAGTGHIGDFIDAFRDFDLEYAPNPDSPGDRILHDPVGVVGLITPWNWPMNQVTLKVLPAIAAGCTMVLKPSEIAPLSSIVFTEVMHAAGTPAGVYNMVNGDGPGVGTQLSGHPGLDMISFTGSARAGILISKNAADTIKRVSLELGGKGANIVFADADAEAVARGAAECFSNSGQSCDAPTRMLVERSIYDQAVATAVATAEATAVDRASKSGDHMGPVVSELQYNKIQTLIEKGMAEGARLVAGGPGRPEGLEKGYFVQPTVFADVDNSMTIAREEIFGPVLSMIPFDDEADALRIANDTTYGLTNYVQTQDQAKGQRLARRLRSGMVQMNGTGLGPATPFGGMRQSGNGREGGVWGIEDFIEVKTVSGWN